jgi:hypothetical protein
MKHRVHIKDFVGYKFEQRIASASGGCSKAIDVEVNPLYRDVMFVVRNCGEKVLTTNSLEIAIEKYNEIE